MSTGTKFTKGEWNIKTTGHYFRGDRQYKHEVLTNDVRVTCLDSAKANAHLIAAAPEMYNKLHEIAVSMECFHGVDTDSIYELLAKARGSE